MTIRECITQVDSLKPNGYSDREKIRWLNEVEGDVKTEIIDHYEEACDCSFSGYSEDDDQAELIAAAPHDRIYTQFLEAQIDLYNGDMDRYNNNIVRFMASYEAFKKFYGSTHMHKQIGFNYLH